MSWRDYSQQARSARRKGFTIYNLLQKTDAYLSAHTNPQSLFSDTSFLLRAQGRTNCREAGFFEPGQMLVLYRYSGMDVGDRTAKD